MPPPNSFFDWVVGSNVTLARRQKPSPKPKLTAERRLLDFHVTTNDNTGYDTIHVSYPRYGGPRGGESDNGHGQVAISVHKDKSMSDESQQDLTSLIVNTSGSDSSFGRSEGHSAKDTCECPKCLREWRLRRRSSRRGLRVKFKRDLEETGLDESNLFDGEESVSDIESYSPGSVVTREERKSLKGKMKGRKDGREDRNGGRKEKMNKQKKKKKKGKHGENVSNPTDESDSGHAVANLDSVNGSESELTSASDRGKEVNTRGKKKIEAMSKVKAAIEYDRMHASSGKNHKKKEAEVVKTKSKDKHFHSKSNDKAPSSPSSSPPAYRKSGVHVRHVSVDFESAASAAAYARHFLPPPWAYVPQYICHATVCGSKCHCGHTGEKKGKWEDETENGCGGWDKGGEGAGGEWGKEKDKKKVDEDPWTDKQGDNWTSKIDSWGGKEETWENSASVKNQDDWEVPKTWGNSKTSSNNDDWEIPKTLENHDDWGTQNNPGNQETWGHQDDSWGKNNSDTNAGDPWASHTDNITGDTWENSNAKDAGDIWESKNGISGGDGWGDTLENKADDTWGDNNVDITRDNWGRSDNNDNHGNKTAAAAANDAWGSHEATAGSAKTGNSLSSGGGWDNSSHAKSNNKKPFNKLKKSNNDSPSGESPHPTFGGDLTYSHKMSRANMKADAETDCKEESLSQQHRHQDRTTSTAAAKGHAAVAFPQSKRAPCLADFLFQRVGSQGTMASSSAQNAFQGGWGAWTGGGTENGLMDAMIATARGGGSNRTTNDKVTGAGVGAGAGAGAARIEKEGGGRNSKQQRNTFVNRKTSLNQCETRQEDVGWDTQPDSRLSGQEGDVPASSWASLEEEVNKGQTQAQAQAQNLMPSAGTCGYGDGGAPAWTKYRARESRSKPLSSSTSKCNKRSGRLSWSKSSASSATDSESQSSEASTTTASAQDHGSSPGDAKDKKNSGDHKSTGPKEKNKDKEAGKKKKKRAQEEKESKRDHEKDNSGRQANLSRSWSSHIMPGSWNNDEPSDNGTAPPSMWGAQAAGTAMFPAWANPSLAVVEDAAHGSGSDSTKSGVRSGSGNRKTKKSGTDRHFKQPLSHPKNEEPDPRLERKKEKARYKKEKDGTRGNALPTCHLRHRSNGTA